MNLNELQRSLRQLRLGGMAAVLETRLQQAQAEPMAPIDLLASLVSDVLTRRSDRLLERRRKFAAFRDPNKTLDNFDFSFNPKMNRSMVFDLATCAQPSVPKRWRRFPHSTSRRSTANYSTETYRPARFVIPMQSCGRRSSRRCAGTSSWPTRQIW